MSDVSQDLSTAVDELLELVPSPEGIAAPAKYPSPNMPGKKNPASFQLQELAREHTETALETILEIMNDCEEEGSTRLEAAKQILDRGWGKAAMKLETKSTVVNVHEVLKQMAGQLKEPPKLAEIVDVTSQEITDA